MVRVIVAVALAAAVQFAWGFTYYGLLSGFDRMTTRAPDEAAQALTKALPASGTYLFPPCPGMNASEQEVKAHEEALAAGPIVQIHYRKEGFAMASMPAFMGVGFAHTLLTAALAACLLRAALPGLRTYPARVAFVAGLGVFAAAATRLSDAIWLHHHGAYVVGQTLFCVSAWLISGAVMAAIVRPAGQGAQASEPARPLAA